MSTISQTTTILAHSMAWALIHSLWQGLLLYATLFVLLKTVPGFSARIKYYLSFGAFTGLFIWFGETLVSQFDRLKEMVVVSSGGEVVAPLNLVIRDIKPLPVAAVSAPSLSHQLLHFIEQNVPSIMTFYIAGLAIMLFRFFINIYLLKALKTQGIIEPESQWNELIIEWSRRFAISRPVKLLLSSKINVPMMLGTLKPVILLPIATLNQLTIEQVEAILMHELAHIKRHDYLLNILQTAGETILFFNPFVWLISRTIRQQRENSCDDLVVANTASPLHYAQALVMLEEGRRGEQQLALAATGNKNQLLDRIKRIMEMKRDRPGYGQLSIIMVSVITLAFIVAMCTFTPSMAQKAKGAKSDTTRRKPIIESKLTTNDSGSKETTIQIDNKPQKQVKAFGSREEMKRIQDSIAEARMYTDATAKTDTPTINFMTKDSTIVFAALYIDPLRVHKLFNTISVAVFRAPFEAENDILRAELKAEVRKAYKKISSPELDKFIDNQVDDYIAKGIKRHQEEKLKKLNGDKKRPEDDKTKTSAHPKTKDPETNPSLIAAKEMEGEGLLHYSHFLIGRLHGELYIDSVKQPKAVADKYAKYFQENSSVEYWEKIEKEMKMDNVTIFPGSSKK